MLRRLRRDAGAQSNPKCVRLFFNASTPFVLQLQQPPASLLFDVYALSTGTEAFLAFKFYSTSILERWLRFHVATANW